MATVRSGYRNGRVHAAKEPDEKASFWNGVVRGLSYFYAVRDFAGHYFEHQARRLKARSKRAADDLVQKILSLVAVAAVLVTTIVLAIVGIAGGLTEALGGRVWAGQLLTAAGLAVVGIISWAVLRSNRRRPSRIDDEDDDF